MDHINGGANVQPVGVVKKLDRDRYNKSMLGLRIDPRVRAALVALSEHENRPQTKVIEEAILELAQRKGLPI